MSCAIPKRSGRVQEALLGPYLHVGEASTVGICVRVMSAPSNRQLDQHSGLHTFTCRSECTVLRSDIDRNGDIVVTVDRQRRWKRQSKIHEPTALSNRAAKKTVNAPS